jgi:hypothetical protein
MGDFENSIATAISCRPWNKRKLTGAKPPLRPKHVWSIRTKLQIEGRLRDLAMFNLAIDSKLRGCDVVAIASEIMASSVAARRVRTLSADIACRVFVKDQQDLVDPKTGEYTPHGVVASMIAGAQVTEMRCGMKGQITAALAKARRLGVPFDLNQKEDYSDVVFLASQLLTRIGGDGVAAWCRDKAPDLAKFLQTP